MDEVQYPRKQIILIWSQGRSVFIYIGQANPFFFLSSHGPKIL